MHGGAGKAGSKSREQTFNDGHDRVAQGIAGIALIGIRLVFYMADLLCANKIFQRWTRDL